jgi:adenosylmethionine-8-amino-7-oxononanoate aminotransferase
MACAASLEVQKIIARRGCSTVSRSLACGSSDALTERFGNHRHVGDIRGRGLFQAVELVADRATRKPFDPALKLHARIKTEAFARGLGCYPMGGTVDGRIGDHVVLAPPYICTDDDIDMIVDRLGQAVDVALKSVGH